VILQELYDQGCRNIGVGGLPPLGCLPFQLSLKFKIDRQCLEDENADSEKYNRKLTQRLSQLQATLPQSKIVYGDIYHPLLNLITNPQHYGNSYSILIVCCFSNRHCFHLLNNILSAKKNS